MELLLVRHGETGSNVLRALDTADPGADLTPLGERQSQDLADYLATAGLDVDAVFCSPRLRTRRTAEPLVAWVGVEPSYREGLAEMSAGEWEMSAAQEHRSGYADVVRAWMSGDPTPMIPGGEPLADILTRFDAVVAEAVALGVGRVALVAHGGIIRTWCAARATGLPDLDTLGSSLRNTGFVRLEQLAPEASGDQRAWRVVEWDAREVAGD